MEKKNFNESANDIIKILKNKNQNEKLNIWEIAIERLN
jgi:hypothetical protein